MLPVHVRCAPGHHLGDHPGSGCLHANLVHLPYVSNVDGDTERTASLNTGATGDVHKDNHEDERRGNRIRKHGNWNLKRRCIVSNQVCV